MRKEMILLFGLPQVALVPAGLFRVMFWQSMKDCTTYVLEKLCQRKCLLMRRIRNKRASWCWIMGEWKS